MYTRICLRKTTYTSITTDGAPANIQTGHLPNTRDALPLEPIHSIPHEKNTVIRQQETLVWGSGFNFKLTDFSNPKKCKDWRTPYVLLLPVISKTNPTVLAGKDNPPDERNSLWVRANISLLATYRLAQNHLPLDITCRNEVYETTSAKIAESCELITSLRDTRSGNLM